MNQLDQTFRSQFDSLPKELQFVLSSLDTRTTLQTIAKKYNLRIDQAGHLEDETLLVLLGLHHPREYIESLEKNVGVSADVAVLLAGDVNDALFAPVHQQLIELYALEQAQNEASSGEQAQKISGQDKKAPDVVSTPTKTSSNLVTSKLNASFTVNTSRTPVSYKGLDPYRETIE